MIVRLAYTQLGLERVYLNVLRVNQRAIKFYNKIGFRYTHSSSKLFGGYEEELMWYEVKTCIEKKVD